MHEGCRAVLLMAAVLYFLWLPCCTSSVQVHKNSCTGMRVQVLEMLKMRRQAGRLACPVERVVTCILGNRVFCAMVSNARGTDGDGDGIDNGTDGSVEDGANCSFCMDEMVQTVGSLTCAGGL